MKDYKQKRHLLYPLLVLSIVLAGAAFVIQASVQSAPSYAEPELVLEGLEAFAGDAVRLAALGDVRSGDRRQEQVADLLDALHREVTLDGIILLGDNTSLIGAPARALQKTFFEPYDFLIEQQVPFYALLGNHDLRRGMKEYQLYFSHYNMKGRVYYSQTFGDGVLEVFFLNSNKLEKDAQQIWWLEQALAQSTARWKVVAMHHPPFTTSKHHPAEPPLRQLLEPVFLEHGVDLVLSGHNHIYERLHPINGITYITSGSGGELRADDLEPNNPLRAAGNDRENVALMLDFTAETCRFAAFNPQGKVVDQGALEQTPETEVAGLKGLEPAGAMPSGRR